MSLATRLRGACDRLPLTGETCTEPKDHPGLCRSASGRTWRFEDPFTPPWRRNLAAKDLTAGPAR